MRLNLNYLMLLYCSAILVQLSAQSTSWIGATSTNWSTSSNWTSGIPTATVDAIIGDANFTGSNQPLLTVTSSCKNLTVGNAVKVSSLSIGRNLTVNGNILIGANGTILASTSNRTITLKGNWTNSGTYTASSSSARVTLSGGVVQTFTGVTTFQRMTVNSGSTLLLANNITVNNALSVSGTINPTDAYSISGTAPLTVNSTGVLLVYRSTFAANYATSGTVTLNRTSTVNYASASIAQTVSSSYTYGTLRISGASTKSLAANLPGLSSSNTSSGRIFIDAGIFDLKTFTANRSASGGGSITIAAGAKLMIGGTNGFPSNYTTHTIAASSTVEFYGNSQTILATTYGNLTLSATTGSVTKTMPATALTIAGTFAMNIGTGTAVLATAAQNITFNGPVNIGSSCTFAGSSYSHLVRSDWTNNGTFTGSTSTLTYSGISSRITGTGTNNFNHLSFTAFGISAAANTVFNVAGNLSTTTPGLFNHDSGGTVNMTGTSRTLSGNGFTFYHLNVSGTIASTASFYVSGNLTNSGTFTASSGITTMNGIASQITNSGTLTLYTLQIERNLTTASNFNVSGNLSVSTSGSFVASAGTLTFNGNSTLNGSVSLNNITVNASNTLYLGSSSILGLKGTFTQSGTFNVTTYIPNTVNYNNSGAQTVTATTYHNLILSGSGTKTPSAAISVNSDFTIQSGVTFNASSYVLSVYRHWNNYGSFTASTSNVHLRGTNAATITGVTTFNDFTVNKSSSLVKVTLANNVTAANIVMTAGNIFTDSHSITTTGGRSGNGIIIGTVIHNHSFANATAYSFEGPHNLITFTNPSGITSVTVVSKIGEILDFDPAMESVIREYEISVPVGTYTSASLRFHYENNELNAFAEPFLALYKYNSGILWDSLGFNSRDTALNYVQYNSITNLNGRFASSGVRNIVRWRGLVSSDWNDTSNWKTISGSNMTTRVPTSTDAAQLGYAAFTYQPQITANHQLSVLRFGSAQSVTLTINSGSLSSLGSIRGQWTASRSHILDVKGAITTGTNLELSDGITGHDIHLKIDSGNVLVQSDLNQSASSQITMSRSGLLQLSGNFIYNSGTFVAGNGTVVYSGGDAQTVANVSYNHLTFNKTTASAHFERPTRVLGHLTLSGAGEILVSDSLTVSRNIIISSGAYFELDNAVLSLAGNWQNSGTFISNNSRTRFVGSSAQTINRGAFNYLIMDKSSGELSLIGEIQIKGELSLINGAFNLDTFKADRTFDGGSLTMSSGTSLKVSGSNNFPAKFFSYDLNATSTVIYNGTVIQNIKNLNYGNLTVSNGASNVKNLTGNITVNGDLNIQSGSTFKPDIYSVNLYGNLVNAGTFMPGSSTLTLNGINKTITGSTTLNNLSVVDGSYTVSSGTITMGGDLFLESTGSLSFGNNNAILDGDLINKGSLTSNGTATFTGTRVQTLQLINAISSTSSGIINFNGSISPIINSNSSPSFATVNINNTAGITPSIPWFVYVAFNVASGATFNAGSLTHRFYGSYTNNGTVNSDGKLWFTPGSPYSSSVTIKLDGVAFNSTGEIEFGGTGAITIQQTAPILNTVIITNTHSSGVTAPGVWNIADVLRIGPGAIFNAGTAITHTISGSLINDGILDGQTSTIAFNGLTSEINGAGETNFNHFRVDNGADLTLNSSINVLRNFTINGTYNGEGRRVSFVGSAASSISGTTSPVVFGELEQNKNGVATTLAVPVTVTDELILTYGLINTSATNYLNIADDAESEPGSVVSFVNGPMRKTGDDAFVFPVGKGSKWARLGISAPSSNTDVFTVQYFDVPYSNTTSMAGSPSPVLYNVSIMEYWTCDRTTGSSSVTVQLFWETSLSGINDYSSDLVVARWTGSAWENKGQTAIDASIPGTVTSAAVTSFSPFTFGSLSASVNPLPITLLNFDGVLNGQNQVELTWKTASETDNHHFVIEKSRDGSSFTELLTINSKGNSQTVQTYSGIDDYPFAGISYYRLKQTDINGISTYSKTIVIILNSEKTNQLIVYPNPVKGLVHIESDIREEAKLLMMDVMGTVIKTISFNDRSISVDLSDYPSGVYYLVLETPSRRETVKLIRE